MIEALLNGLWIPFAACLMLGLCCALIGTFSYLERKSLYADSIAHSLLPGLILGYLIIGNKDPFILLLGAFGSGYVSIALTDYIMKRSNLKSDAAIGIVLSGLFGIGILLLTFIQHRDGAGQSGLENYLFGKAASINLSELKVIILVIVVILLIIIPLFRAFKIYIFNPEFAQSLGLPIGLIRFLLRSMYVLVVVIGVQAVGIVLIAALIITPAAIARQFSNRLAHMILLSALIGMLCTFFGALYSLEFSQAPTGPWIVVFLSFGVLLSLLFSPNKGFIVHQIRRIKRRVEVEKDHILKQLFHQEEQELADSTFAEKTDWNVLQKILLLVLHKKGLVLRQGKSISLTPKGLNEAKKIVRRHRLWELYLNRYLNVPVNQVHPSAEFMEHHLTQELEALLLNELDHPLKDPHNKHIPS